MSEQTTLHLGDCLEVMKGFPDNHFTAIVSDPPYGLSFMLGHIDWDKSIPGVEVWEECLRVVKPGGFLLAFGGTRTFHRLAVAIEDAGWVKRDCIASWTYASGFPKSANVSKHIDQKARNDQIKIVKAIDGLDIKDMLQTWISGSRSVIGVDVQSLRSPLKAGRNMRSEGFVADHVILQVSHESERFHAAIVEPQSFVPRHTIEALWSTAGGNADPWTKRSSSDASSVGSKSKGLSLPQSTTGSIVPCAASAFPAENMGGRTMAVEALRTWLGKGKSSRKETISALCAAMSEDLKRTILSLSPTFQGFDMTQKMECVSATSVTITAYMVERLIINTADTLRKECLDKAAGAEREVVGRYRSPEGTSGPNSTGLSGAYSGGWIDEVGMGLPPITAPATPEAEQWEGYGTALAPAWEPVLIFMKPLDGTYADNALTHGVAGLNIDAARIPTGDKLGGGAESASLNHFDSEGMKGWQRPWMDDPQAKEDYAARIQANVAKAEELGRWPKNVIFDEGAAELLDASVPPSKSSNRPRTNKASDSIGTFKTNDRTTQGHQDSGGPSRFYYVPKPSKKEKGAGVGHPTIKPIALMEYLVKLVTYPDENLILDPFMGSGTTGIACANLGVPFHGIEREEKYFKIAQERIREATAETSPLVQKGLFPKRDR